MAESSFSLRDKVIVQCGGTGLLGRALTAGLGSAGATVIVASRDRAKLETAVAPGRAAGQALSVEEVDITNEASVAALRDRVLAHHGRIDGLVFNCG